MENYTRPELDSTPLELLVNTSLVDVLAEKIRSNIYSGKYEANKKLIVRELAEEFGVSHTPIKDALNRLVSEGFIEAPPRKSMYVRSFSNEMIIDSMHARLMCELFCANDIIRAAEKKPEIVQEMQKTTDMMRNLVEQDGPMPYDLWVENEIRFHECYMSQCGNSTIYKFYRTVHTNRDCYFTYLGNQQSPASQKGGSARLNVLEHQKITDAVKNLDVRQFLHAVYEHISRVTKEYVVNSECQEKYQQMLRNQVLFDL